MNGTIAVTSPTVWVYATAIRVLPTKKLSHNTHLYQLDLKKLALYLGVLFLENNLLLRLKMPEVQKFQNSPKITCRQQKLRSVSKLIFNFLPKMCEKPTMKYFAEHSKMHQNCLF